MQQPPTRPGPPQGPNASRQFGSAGVPGGPRTMSGPPGPPIQPVLPEPIPPEAGDLKKKSKKKKNKRKRKDSSESDSDSDGSCECQSAQPTTQIFISQGGAPQQFQPPGTCPDYNMGDDECPKCMTWEQWCQEYFPQNGSSSSPPIGGSSCQQSNGKQPCPPVICCPPCGTQKSKKSKAKSCTPVLCCPPTDASSGHCPCCSSQQKGKDKKNERSSLEGMMPATQQFLMFLQAYGLAAALIRDRCARATDKPKQGDGSSEKQHRNPDSEKESNRKSDISQ